MGEETTAKVVTPRQTFKEKETKTVIYRTQATETKKIEVVTNRKWHPALSTTRYGKSNRLQTAKEIWLCSIQSREAVKYSTEVLKTEKTSLLPIY